MRARQFFLATGLIGALFPSSAFAGGAAVSATTGERLDVVHNTIGSFSTEGNTIVEQVLWQGDGGETLWVLPLPPGAQVVRSSDALVSVFDRALEVVVRTPPNKCLTGQNGECFGGTSAGGSVGGDGTLLPVAGPVLWPLEQSESIDAPGVASWFADFGVTPPADLMAAVETAEQAGYGFLLVRLPAGSGLLTSAALRISTSEASSQVVPMLGPRSDAEVNLTVIGKSRYAPLGQSAVVIEEQGLEWNWDSMQSNYYPLAGEAIAAGWLTEAGEPLSPFAFEKLFTLANNEPLASGYDPAADAAAAAAADAEALRMGLSSGSTWVTRLATRVPAAGFPALLALSPVDALTVVDRDLTPATETGIIPTCEAQDACGHDFVDDGMDGDADGCAAVAKPARGGWLLLAAAALGLASRKRRLPIG